METNSAIDKFNPIPSSLFLHYQYLFSGPLLSGLSFHLLYFKRVYTPPPHKQVMVPYTQLEDLPRETKPRMSAMYKNVSKILVHPKTLLLHQPFLLFFF